MLEDYKEIQPESGQTPDKGATELPDIPQDKLSGMPKEVVDLYANAKEALKAATQRNQEVAEERKRAEVDKEYLEQQRQELYQERQKFYDQLQEQHSRPYQPPPQTDRTPPPSFDVDPLAAYKHLQERVEKQEKEFGTKYGELEKKTKEYEDALTATQRAVSYQRFFDREIATKFPKVKEEDLDEYLVQHPNMPSNPDTLRRAATEITNAKNTRLEAEYQEYLKEKEEQAKAATIQGAGNVGAPKPVKNWNDLTEEEQIEVAKEQAEKFKALENR